MTGLRRVVALQLSSLHYRTHSVTLNIDRNGASTNLVFRSRNNKNHTSALTIKHPIALVRYVIPSLPSLCVHERRIVVARR